MNNSIAFPSDEQQLFQEFERKLQIIRDRVSSVAHNYHTGCYLVGRPGTSKTYTVMEELGRLERPSLCNNARMSPYGLFCLLDEHRDHVTVLDDITSVFKNEQAMEILLAALDGRPGKPRTITYKTKDKDLSVPFSGAIIAISNVPMRCDRLAHALGSRIVVLEHEPTDDELAAFIRYLAAKGFMDLTADECAEVAEFIISETRQYDLRLDLRHLTKGWQDYRQYKHGRSQTTWRDLIRTSLHKTAGEPFVPRSKQEDMERQRQRVRESVRQHPNDRHAQIEASGLKSSTFYNRLKEIQAEPQAA